MLVFLSLYSYKFGPVGLFQLIDGLQAGMSNMVLEKLFIADLQKVSGNLERKICAVGVVKILAEYPPLMSSEASLKIWAGLLESLVCLFELPEDSTTGDDEHFIDGEETPGYQSTFNQLFSASRKEPDPFNGQVPNARAFLAKQLETVQTTMSFSVSLQINSLKITNL